MFRHVIAPARFFTQVPNEILRHPHLSSDAVRLLSWQLSLPEDADEPLSKTARRANIGKCGYQRAKRELKDAGFLHEWRRQGLRGRWRTTQLLSNVSLTAEEAAAAAGLHVPAETQVAPSAAAPAAGPPTGRAVGRQPRKDLEENTSHPPAEASEEAEQFLLDLARAHPRLAISRKTAARWAEAATPWLDLGLPRERLVSILTDGLDTARSPMGVLHWRLVNALHDTAAAPAPEQAPPRTASMRECAGEHTQPRLFTPVADEKTCGECRTAAAAPSPEKGDGYRTFLAARRTLHSPA